jgi:hypothetical protein
MCRVADPPSAREGPRRLPPGALHHRAWMLRADSYLTTTEMVLEVAAGAPLSPANFTWKEYVPFSFGV